MKRTGAQAVIESLLYQGVDTIFGYPGGAIMPIYDALYDYKDKVRHVLVRHEQAAAHAAEGYARALNKPGVCFATSGPGATNLVTGIMDAMMDSVPIVCITGQVASHLVGTDAFQEADVIGITTPITKWNYQITQAKEIPSAIAKAFHIASTGRPGPVVIDITKDAQFDTFTYAAPKSIHIPGYNPTIKPHLPQIKRAAQVLNEAKRPYLLIGHGVLISHAEEEVRQLAEVCDMPTATTLHGLSAFPSNHPLFVGLLGMHGNYAPNMMTNKADVILAIGMRFDDRVTGRLKDYANNATVIHIDIDPAELNKNVKTLIPIVANAKLAVQELIPFIEKKQRKEWINSFKEHYDLEHKTVIQKETHNNTGDIKMAEVINMLSEKTLGESIIVSDVGQHQMVTARYYKFQKTNSFITSGGAGTMGFALPAAIGAKVAQPKRDVISIIGDGCFQMTLQELATIAQEKLPVKIIILNNHYLGMVRQWQELFFEKRYSFVTMQNPDFIQVAKGFFIDGKRISKREELSNGLDTLLQTEGPYILEVEVEQEHNVFPMIPTGASVDEVRLA